MVPRCDYGRPDAPRVKKPIHWHCYLQIDSDPTEDATAFARRGIYPETVLTDLPEYFRLRYFERIDHGFRVSKALRQTVIFGQQDISRGVPFLSLIHISE